MHNERRGRIAPRLSKNLSTPNYRAPRLPSVERAGFFNRIHPRFECLEKLTLISESAGYFERQRDSLGHRTIFAEEMAWARRL
jgi:hypothetical protein